MAGVNVNMLGVGTRNVIYVATMSNSVYARSTPRATSASSSLQLADAHAR